MASEIDSDASAKNKDAGDSEAKAKEMSPPMASISETFSFGLGLKQKLYIAIGVVNAIVAGLMYPALAFFFAQVFEEFTAEPDALLQNVRKMAYSFMVLGCVIFVGMTSATSFLEAAATDMTCSLKSEWFGALLRQDMAYHDVMGVTKAATVISTNAAKYRKGVGRKLGEGIQYSITAVGGLVYAFYVSWQTSLIVLAALPLMALAGLFVTKINTSVSAVTAAGYAEAGSTVYTTISKIRTVLSLNAAPTMVELYFKGTKSAYDAAVSRQAIMGIANGSAMAAYIFSFLVLTLYGTYLLYQGVSRTGCDPSGGIPYAETCEVKGADVFGALMGLSFGGGVFPQVAVALQAFTGARVACKPAVDAISRNLENSDKDPPTPPMNPATTGSDDEEKGQTKTEKAPVKLPIYEIDSSSDLGLKPESTKGEIEFHNVTFHYPARSEQTIFDGLSLKIESGKTVALVGPSGGGKSTVVGLIERFYDPVAGRVTLDGNDLKDLNVAWLRRHIGLVSQEPVLFARSIAENIAYGRPDATRAEIEEAAKMANAHDFIIEFPDGYDTDAGDAGAQLSGGQKQRIAIARVLVANPEILLLDEATSALDSESEFMVQQALDDLLNSSGENSTRTTIVIAHRLSTIRNADMIAVVAEGKIVETGTHRELMSIRDGHYRQLVNSQTGKSGVESNVGIAHSGSSNVSENHEDDDSGFLGLFGKKSPDDKKPLLSFHDVTFSYPSRPERKVFDGLNLSIEKGETMAIVGPSGGGKSTVIQLLERFYDPDAGEVKYDGTNLTEINVTSLRELVGLVQQEPSLFPTTVGKNISYGMPDATQEQIEEAARLANAHDFIIGFPDGYDTDMGDTGSQISGGQKQRIAIARAIIKKPNILLLDEATSALDSESEAVVQQALDNLVQSGNFTVVVIAHRLSTIRNADRIAVLDGGKVAELGTHNELMRKHNGIYRRLQNLQAIGGGAVKAKEHTEEKNDVEETEEIPSVEVGDETTDEKEDIEEKSAKKKNASRARVMAKADSCYFFIGSIGAVLAGIMFPAWGIVFAYMIEALYYPVAPCEGDLPPVYFATEFDNCDEYINDAVSTMKSYSFNISYGWAALMFCSIVGNCLLFYGFGTASERMNKRVRDAAFRSLVRQEVSYFDLRSVGELTNNLQEDAALIHSFSGEPIRSLFMNLASLAVGLIFSFYYMWPFALLTLAILPAMGFGAEMEMKMYLGEDEGIMGEEDDAKGGQKRSGANASPGSLLMESLTNIRTVASLAIENDRLSEYENALARENPQPLMTSFKKGFLTGLGQFIQMWGMALMFFWGGWLLYKYPNKFSYNDFLISMFSLLFSLSGTAAAAQGATDKVKAQSAADRIFDLIDRKGKIDPLDEDGLKLQKE